MNFAFAASNVCTVRVWGVLALMAMCQACSPVRPVPDHVTDAVRVTPSTRGAASAATSRGVLPLDSPPALTALLARSDNVPPARSILPEGLFGAAVAGRAVDRAPVGSIEPDLSRSREPRLSSFLLPQPSVVAASLPVAIIAATPPRVLVYASPTTRA